MSESHGGPEAPYVSVQSAGSDWLISIVLSFNSLLFSVPLTHPGRGVEHVGIALSELWIVYKFFVLRGCSVFGPLARDRRMLLGLFFGCAWECFHLAPN